MDGCLNQIHQLHEALDLHSVCSFQFQEKHLFGQIELDNIFVRFKVTKVPNLD